MTYQNEEKIRRMQIIKNSIIKARKARKFVQYEMLLSEICTEFGLRRKTAAEYLGELIDARFIVLEEGKEIFLSKDFEDKLFAEFEAGLKEDKKISEVLNDAKGN